MLTPLPGDVYRVVKKLMPVVSEEPETAEGAAVSAYAAISLLGYVLISRGLISREQAPSLCGDVEMLVRSAVKESEAQQC